MKTNHELLLALKQAEIEGGLYEVKIKDIILWRLVRSRFRVPYLRKHTGFNNKSAGFKINKVELLRFYFISLFQFVKLILKGRPTRNILFAFPRLFEVKSTYIDKFTDPVIEYSDLKDDVLIFQHSFGSPHYQPRVNDKRVVYSDFVDISARVLSKALLLFYLARYSKTFKQLIRLAEGVYGEDHGVKVSDIAADFITYDISSRVYGLVIPKLKPVNIFVVNRYVFDFIFNYKHRKQCKIFEFQHGITQSETVLYSGLYDKYADPDYFLAFGKAWVNEYYGVPKNKIVNIGWAYSDYVKDTLQGTENADANAFLVISSPAITENILNLTLALAVQYPEFSFHIRLHPQEKLNVAQSRQIKDVKGILLLDNQEDSIFAVQRYQNIIGDNSTVLYEALSMGKKVGKLNMYGMKSKNSKEDKLNGFILLHKPEDIQKFFGPLEINPSGYYYSTFKAEIFNRLIK